MHRSLRIAAAVLVAAPVVAAAQRPLALTRPESEFSEPFTSISGIRELRDGRVLVADVRDKTLQLIDLRSGAASAVGREGSGPGEYSLPMRLVALPGDSTALFDAGNQRYLTILPDGKTGRDFRLEAATQPSGDGGRGGRGGFVMSGLSIPRGFDAKGNIYYEGMPFSLNDAGEMVSADSVAVLRFDRAARRVDTVAYRKVVKANAQVSGGRGNMNVRIGTGNPLAPADDWAALPDGRVAVVRAADYHLDVFSAANRKVSGAPVPYEKIRVDAAVKKMIEDQRARNSRNAVRMTVSAGAGGGTQRSTEIGGARPGEIPPLTDWPDVMPPFQANAAFARPNGEVWVLRTRKPGDDIPTYDVFDGAGRVIGRVALPKDHRLIGFGQGTVYLIRSDADDLQYLQRYRLAMDAKLTG